MKCFLAAAAVLAANNGAGGAADGTGDALLFAPPLIIEREQIAEAVRIVGESLDAALEHG